MALQIPQGFILQTQEPVDSRQSVVSRLDQSTFTAYQGLIVFDQTTGRVYFLNDANDPSLETSWSEFGTTAGSTFLARLTETVDSTATLVTEYQYLDESSTATFVAYSFKRSLVNGRYFILRVSINNESFTLDITRGYSLQTQAQITALAAMTDAEQLIYLRALVFSDATIITT